MTNIEQLRNSVRAAENGFRFALNAQDYVAASRWRELIVDARAELELTLRMEKQKYV